MDAQFTVLLNESSFDHRIFHCAFCAAPRNFGNLKKYYPIAMGVGFI